MNLRRPHLRRPLDPRAAVALVAYTAIVWIGRTRNILVDDDLGGVGRIGRLLVAVIFLGLAGLVVARWHDRRAPLGVLCLWTVVYWPIRAIMILAGDWGAGFKAVHTILAAASLALAAWAWPGRRPGDT